MTATLAGSQSQLILNLNALGTAINNATNLPPTATGIKQNAVALINTDVNTLKSIQTAVVSFAQPTRDSLNAAIQNIQNGNLSAAVATINTLNKSAAGLLATITGSTNTVANTKNQVLGLLNDVSALEQSINNQVVSLKSQADDAQNQADYYNSRKYYFLALGPFGLVGLGIAVGFLVSWTQKANSFTAQAASLQTQATALKQLISGLTDLSNNFTLAVTQISNVKNAVDFLSSDVNTVIDDMNQSNTSAALMYLNTALVQLQTLQTDAS